ncbi:MAG: hypothetical protein B7733_18240 [Myxococcales bacterium FL481]|nr:MAG: hypothetical protein B7733_18240 [Myxococcales bacterium FL481]
MVRKRTRAHARILTGLAGTIGGSGCTADVGQVELNWVFVDRNTQAYVPSDLRKDSCRLPARDADGPTTADLIVQLTLSDPDCASAAETTAEAEACQVIAPAHFRCVHGRHTLTDVPAADEPYLVTAEVVVVPARGTWFIASSQCIGVPGPRRRRVSGGALTDLSVYQFVVHNVDLSESPRLDLELCRDPDV